MKANNRRHTSRVKDPAPTKRTKLIIQAKQVRAKRRTHTRKSGYAARLLDQESGVLPALANNRGEVLKKNAEFFSAKIQDKLVNRIGNVR